MRKGPVRSTTCTSLALLVALAGAAGAQVPEPGACFVRDYDAAHLARNPQQGVAGMTAWVFDQVPGAADSRAMTLAVRLADQGPAVDAGLGGATLRQILPCAVDGPDAGTCFVECDGGTVTLSARADGGLELATAYLAIGEEAACGGGVIDLAEGGARTLYRLAAAPAAACADLATPRPLPASGCYGAEGLAGPVETLRLIIDPPTEEMPGAVFSYAGGRLEVTFAPQAEAGALAGTAQILWMGCSAFDGLCRHSDGTGHFTLVAEAGGLRLASPGMTIYSSEEDAEVDVTAAFEGLPVLAARPMAACAGLETE